MQEITKKWENMQKATQEATMQRNALLLHYMRSLLPAHTKCFAIKQTDTNIYRRP